MSYWIAIYRFAWALLLVLCVVGLVFLFLPQCRRLEDLKRRRAALRREVVDTRAEIRELTLNQERFATNPAFVERTARESGESGMVKPNEIVFRLPPHTNPPSSRR